MPKKIKLDRYWTPKTFKEAVDKGYLRKGKDVMLLDMSDLPEEYEVVIRSVKNKKRQQVIYQNLKERG